jgi:hypothetical protein
MLIHYLIAVEKDHQTHCLHLMKMLIRIIVAIMKFSKTDGNHTSINDNYEYYNGVLSNSVIY